MGRLTFREMYRQAEVPGQGKGGGDTHPLRPGNDRDVPVDAGSFRCFR